MSAFLSPLAGAGWRFLSSTGAVLSGGKLFTYLAGSVNTNQATWTDSTQAVQNANPVILDSTGQPPNEVWLANGVAYKFVLTDAAGNTLGSWDNVVGINVTSFTQSEWVTSGYVPTYISATSFSVPGDQTGILQVNRRVRYTVNSGALYGTISTSTYDGSSKTTVVIVPDAAGLDISVTLVDYALISATHTSIPVSITGGNATGGFNFLKGPDIASATTPNIWTSSEGNVISITGTTPTTGFSAAPQAGSTRTLIAAAAWPLTNGANLILPGSVNYTCAAGDRLEVVAITTTQFRVSIFKADGTPVIGNSGTVVLSATTASGQAQIDLTTGIDATYDEYQIRLINFTPGSNGDQLQILTSTDGGSTFANSAGNYAYSSMGNSTGAATPAGTSPASTTSFVVANQVAVSNVLAGSGINGVITLSNPASSTINKAIAWDVTYAPSSGTAAREIGGGFRLAITAVNAIRLKWITGVAATGTVKLVGIRKTP
ncbi:MAG: hypothetical protein JWR07_1897 [Nevskia sp.]|nr:hypothetical protein [Nevskia sp.]